MSTDNHPSASAAIPMPPTRILRRTRPLPNGRAVVGALLIAVAGVGAFATAQRADADPATRYVVVTRAVAPGARLGADDLALRAMTLDPTVAEHAYLDPTRLVGSVTLAPLAAGQLLQRAELAPATTVDGTALAPGHELTIPVPTGRMPVGLRRGEAVAVLATYGTGNDARTVVTVQRATVLAVGDPGDSLTARGSATLTLALPAPEAVLETAHAAQVADLTIVRATQADADLPPTYATEPARPAGSGAKGTP